MLPKSVWLLIVGFSIVHARHTFENKNGFTFGDETEQDFQDDFAPPSNHAKVARDLVYRANWTAFGTVSTIKDIAGFPMVSISSVSDSRIGAPSTGRIYFYVAKESLKYKDLVKKNQATLLFSEAQDASCQKRGVDEMEPTCMRAMITGQVYQLKNGTEEFDFGRAAFVSRHPAAFNWLEVHGMVLCRVQIQNILVVDFYGGSKNVTVEDYYRYKSDNDIVDDIPFEVQVDQPIVNTVIKSELLPPTDHAKVARDLVHHANWTSFGTISSVKNIRGYPMVSISSVADSRNGAKSTGNIYFYVAKESLKYKDLVVKNAATVLFSEAQDRDCESRGVDPMEPTCMRAMISGTVLELKNGTAEFQFGRSAFVDRHPAANDWLEVHGMVLCQLQIQNILVIDFYGGAKKVSVKDYYKVPAFETRHQIEFNTPIEFGSEEKVDSIERSDKSGDLDSNERVHIRIHKSRRHQVIDIYV